MFCNRWDVCRWRYVTRATHRKAPPYLERHKMGNGVVIVALLVSSIPYVYVKFVN